MRKSGSRSTRALRIAETLSLPIEFVTETIALLAIKGAGKTYAFLKLAEQMIRADLPVVIVDHVGVCWGLRSSADGKKPGLKVYVLGGSHGDAPLDAHAGRIVAEWIVRSRVSAVLDLSLFTTKAEELRFVAEFSDTLYRKNRQPVHVFVDEADEFAPQKPRGDATRSLHAIEMLVRRGRARGIGITMATQRPAVLNKDVLTQAGTLMFGRVVSPHDRKAVAAWLEGQTTPADVKTITFEMPRMQRGTFQIWSPAFDVLEKIQIAERETFDSSATPKAGQTRRAPKRAAEVDLDKLADEMKAAREQAEANDPGRLRKEIAKLKSDLAIAEQQRWHNASIANRRQEVKTKTINVPIITERERTRLMSIDKTLAKLGHTIDEQGRAFGTTLQSILSRLSKHEREADTAGKQLSAAMKAVHGATGILPNTVVIGDKAAKALGAKAGGTFQRKGNKVTHTTFAGDESSHEIPIAAGMRQIMTVAIQHGGVTKAQLGIYLGIRARGSTLKEYIRRLRSIGWLDTSGDRIVPTALGKQQMGPIDEIPTDRASLIKYWRDKLGEGGMRRIFDLVAAGGEIARDNIATALAVEPKGSTLKEYLRRLRALGVVEVSGDNVRLSDVFNGA